jgi:hypothetical protein
MSRLLISELNSVVIQCSGRYELASISSVWQSDDAFGKLVNAAVAVGLADHEAEATVNSGLDAWSVA